MSLNHWGWADGRGMSSASLATGGSGRGAIVPTEVNNLNAAQLVHLKGRTFGVTWREGEFLGTIADQDRENMFPAAASYWQKNEFLTRNLEMQTRDVSIAIAGFVRPRLSVGLSAHRFSYLLRGEGAGPNYGKSPRQKGTESLEWELVEPQVDLSAMYIATPNLGLGLVFYNLLKSQELSETLRQKAAVGFGLNYLQNPLIRYRLDVISGFNVEEKPLTVSLGTELFWNQWLCLRLGEEYLPATGKADISAGIGFDGPVFGVSYAYAKEVHWLDLSLPL